MLRKRKVKFADGGRTVILEREKKPKDHINFARIARNTWKFSVPAIVLFFIIIYKLFVRAEVLSYYPASCLGNWQNVVNAVGEPSLGSDSTPDKFTADNSVVYSGGDGQIFCGNFSKDASNGDAFKKATLHLIWNIVFPDAAVSQGIPSSSPDSGSSNTSTSSAPMPVTATSSGSGTQAANTSAVAPSSNAAVTSTANNSPVPQAGNTSANVTSTDNASSGGTNTSNSPPASGQTSTPQTSVFPPVPQVDSSSQSSFLRFLLPVAFADNTQSSSVVVQSNAGDTSTTPVVIPPSSTPSSTLSIPFDPSLPLATSSISQSSAGNIVEVSFSLDGVQWHTLDDINEANWQNANFDLPIHSWDELNKLQIAIKGLAGTDGAPTIYLEGMIVDVEADVPNPFSQLLTPTPPLPKPNASIYDATAHQTCEITPFSETTKAGGGVEYYLTLRPANEQLLYTTEFGSLPDGVTASLRAAPPPPQPTGTVQIATSTKPGAASSSATSSLSAASSTPNPVYSYIDLQTSGTTEPGSFSLVFVYKERETNGESIPNFCQYNLIVE